MDKKDGAGLGKLLTIVRKFKKENGFDRIILFGSYARGDYGSGSDVDLLIVDRSFRKKSRFKRTKGLWIKWHSMQRGYPADFICYSPEEFGRLKKQVSLVSEAIMEGIEV